jgi:hypothetical protein
MIPLSPDTAWGRFTRSELFEFLAAVALGLLFYTLQGDPADEILARWQVGVMAAGAFMMLFEPLQVAALRRAAPRATRLDRLYFPFLLGLFWGCAMMLFTLDEGWPWVRVSLLIWAGAAVFFATLMMLLDRGEPIDEVRGARYRLDETAEAAALRRRWQIAQMFAVALVLGLAVAWPAMWDRPAFPVFLLVLVGYAGPPVRYAEGRPRAGLRRTMTFLGVFAFVAGYAVG